jgi:hypothetical protein
MYSILLLPTLSLAVQYNRLSYPSPLHLSELVNRLTEPSSPSVSLDDRIRAVILSAGWKIGNATDLVSAQLRELNLTESNLNKTVSSVESNENARQTCIVEYNSAALHLNQLINDMTLGSQQINDVIGLTNRVKATLHSDITKINEAIDVTNDWLVRMDSWVSFVSAETSQIDGAQAKLLDWGDKTRQNVNFHEVAFLQLGRDTLNLGTDIASLQNSILAMGNALGYTPATLTITEAAGGTSDGLFPWLS